MKRLVMAFLVVVGAYATFGAAQAQSSCKACADQQKACMKNYGGSTCNGVSNVHEVLREEGVRPPAVLDRIGG